MVTLAKGKQNVSACIFDVVMSCACALEPRIYNDCGNWSGPSTGLDPLVLLCNSFAIPKLQYLLHTAPCFKSHSLQHYDDVLRSTVSKVANIHLNMDDSTWLLATLPVKLGALGIRSSVMVAPSAFLASSTMWLHGHNC